MRYFFYGTLLDADVRRLVLGFRFSGTCEATQLDGYRRVAVPGKTYPALVAGPWSVAGLLVSGVTPLQRTRLVAYEGRDYREVERTMRDTAGSWVAARVFVPLRPPRRAVDWSFDRWQRVAKQRVLSRLFAVCAPYPARTAIGGAASRRPDNRDVGISSAGRRAGWCRPV